MCFYHCPAPVFMRSRRIDHVGRIVRTRQSRRTEGVGTLPRTLRPHDGITVLPKRVARSPKRVVRSLEVA